MRPRLAHIPRCLAVAICVLVPSVRVAAAEPAIRNLDVRGLQIGGTTSLVIDGEGLGSTPRLLFSFPAEQRLKPGSTGNKAAFDVTLDGSVQPGYYQLRVVADGGVSSPVVIAVDRLPQRTVSSSVEQLPVALHGTVSGSSVSETKLAGKAGQKLLIEVEAQRLGSKLRPVVHLIGRKRLHVGWSWPTSALFGDTRLETTLPEEGTYVVTVHDAEYGPPGPAFFRLRMGQWSFVDQVFPPVIGRGQSHAFELLGSSTLPRVDLPAAAEVEALPLPWPKDGIWSGPRPFVQVSSQAEVVERESPAGVQEIPVGRTGSPSYGLACVSGRLQKPHEEDRYRLAATPGSKLRMEVFAERYGSPLDVALVVRNERGDALARAEDGPGTLDPVLEYTVPGGVNAVLVGVVDAQGRGGPRGVYRLTIEPQPSPHASTDFLLWTPTESVSLPGGGRRVVPIFVERRGYSGSVQLAPAGLPAGVRIEGAEIPQEAEGTLLTIHRGEAAASASITTWRGRSADGQQRPVVIFGHQQQRLQPWLATEIAVATAAAKGADFQVDWRGLPADAALVLAGKLALGVKVVRPADKPVEKGAKPPDKPAVRLTLLTSQFPPLVNGQPDPNRSLRPEKPLEIAPADREGAITLLVPAELPSFVYDVAIQADLLAADKRTVLATAFTPVRRLAVRTPLVVQLAGPSRIEAVADPKKETFIKIQGKVERRDGLKGDVAVSLGGLPAGVRADPVMVKGDASDFTLTVVLPANQPAGELALKVFATAVPNPQQPNTRVRSREVDVVLIVKPLAN